MSLHKRAAGAIEKGADRSAVASVQLSPAQPVMQLSPTEHRIHNPTEARSACEFSRADSDTHPDLGPGGEGSSTLACEVSAADDGDHCASGKRHTFQPQFDVRVSRAEHRRWQGAAAILMA